MSFINNMATVRGPTFEHTLLFHYHLPGEVKVQTLNCFAKSKSKDIKIQKNYNVKKLTERKGEIDNSTEIIVANPPF